MRERLSVFDHSCCPLPLSVSAIGFASFAVVLALLDWILLLARFFAFFSHFCLVSTRDLEHPVLIQQQQQHQQPNYPHHRFRLEREQIFATLAVGRQLCHPDSSSHLAFDDRG